MHILFMLKANKSQAKEIKRLLIRKKIQVELTSMDDTMQNSRKINTVAHMIVGLCSGARGSALLYGKSLMFNRAVNKF